MTKYISTRFTLALVFGLMIATYLLPQLAQASGESYGWFAPTVDYIDQSTLCPSNKKTLDISLANYNSTSTFSGSVGVWYVNTLDSAGNILTSDMYNGQLLSNPICVEPANYYVQVIVNETSSIYGFNSPSVLSTHINGMSPDVGLFTSDHVRGYVHLQTKGGLGSISNISSIFPNGEALQSTPDFIVRTNNMPVVYGPSTLKSIEVYAYNLIDSSYQTITVPASGGVATRQITGMPALTSEGPYLWYFHQNFTGTNLVKTSYGASWTYTTLPTTGLTTPLSFIIDSSAPETNSITEVKTTASIGSNQIQAQIKITGQDTISGVAHSALIIRDANNPTVIVSQIDTDLSGQLDLLNLDFDVTFNENQSYTITHELTDKAGNISVSNTVTYSSPSVISLSAPTLEARDAENIETTQADIPSFISSNGGSSIIERGTCWVLQETDFTSPTGQHCLSETSWITLSDIGKFSFTHLSLPASTTIYYRGYAINGNATGYSPVRSFVTKPYGDVLLPVPTLPVIGNLYASGTTANSVEAILSIADTGGALITQKAICWDTDVSALPTVPATGTKCYVDNTLMNFPYTLPYVMSKSFYGLPTNSTIYIKGFVANAVGTTTQILMVNTPQEILDFAQPDFSVISNYDSASKTYDLNFSVSAEDLSNFLLPPIFISSPPQSLPMRNVPYSVHLTDFAGTEVASLNGSVDVANYSPTAPIPTPLNLTNINPGVYQLKVEVNDPESTYPERVSSTTAGFNNVRIKLLNLPDPDVGPGPTPPPIYIAPSFSLYFDRSIARSQVPTKLYWNTVLALDLNCKIYGGSDFGPTAIYNFNPSIDGPQGFVELNKLKNYQTFRLTCIDNVAGTGLNLSTTTSITLTGSYSQI